MRLGDTPAGHPGVNQAVAEIVRQGIGEQGRKPFEGQFRKVGKDKGFMRPCQRHGQGRKLDAGRDEPGVVFERVVSQFGVKGHGSDGFPPNADFDG